MINKTLTLTMLTFMLTACSEQTPSNPPTEPVTATEKTTVEPVSESVAASNDTNDESTNDGIVGPLMFNLTDLEGKEVNASDFRGKWLVINYWATWCGPCRDEMPELVKFQEENADTVQVVGIAFEDATVEKLKNFAKDFNINYPLLTIDVYNPPEFAAEGGLGLPTTIVYDQKGMRHKKHMGPIDAAGLLKMVQ